MQKGFAVVYLLFGVLVLTALGGAYYYASNNLNTLKPVKPVSSNTVISKTSKFIDQASVNSLDICNFINNSTFNSIEKLERGLGPNGPEKSYWIIEFKDRSTFQWFYSDVVVNGSYSCTNNSIRASDNTGKVISVVYDSSQQLLEWNGVKYKKTK